MIEGKISSKILTRERGGVEAAVVTAPGGVGDGAVGRRAHLVDTSGQLSVTRHQLTLR